MEIDSAISRLLASLPGAERINNFRVGDSRDSLLRNTAGYSFLRSNNLDRDNVTGRLDHSFSPHHLFSASFLWNQNIAEGPGSAGYGVKPVLSTDTRAKLLSLAWRWSPTARLTNEMRGGFNATSVGSDTTERLGPFMLAGTIFSNPQDTTQPSSRTGWTINYADNTSYLRGRHHLQFGFQMQRMLTRTSSHAGVLPTYTLGIGAGNPGLGAPQLPQIGASDLAAANSLLATLAGYVTSFSQTFNVTSRNSGFVPGAARVRHYSLTNHAGYFQDTWKPLRRLSLSAGLRYEYYTVPDERDSLSLLPRLIDNNFITTLLSNATLDFAGSAAGRPWHRSDRNNFAPSVGFAWDLFGTGKTALRGGYSINHVNDEQLFAVQVDADYNAGLAANVTQTGLRGRLGSGLPAVTAPAFQVPRTVLDNYRMNPFSVTGLPDPNLRTPYVQQWSLGIQRDIHGSVLEVRYVGNRGKKMFRSPDYNQVRIHDNGFLADFERAQRNGNLARATTGVFNPAYTPEIVGSQPLLVFPLLVNGGLLTNATVRSLIETGQPGELASFYQSNRLNGPLNFFPSPYTFVAATLGNFSSSSYDALQADIRHRSRRGLQFQGNYTFAKVLSDTAGENAVRAEAFLDLNNPRIERARAPFDITHAFRTNTIYELPFGRGHRFNAPLLERLMSGWAVSSYVAWQSGPPFSVLSRRGTLNRAGLSLNTNTANTLLDKTQLGQVFQFRQTGSGPFFVNAAAIGSDGRAVAPDGQTPFTGQVFFHPRAGQIGSLQRRMFSGPWVFHMDFALIKSTKIRETHNIEFRVEASNVLNHPQWTLPDQDISSTNFGRLGGGSQRVLQLSLHYRF